MIYARLYGDVVKDDLLKGNKAILRGLEESSASRLHLVFDCTAVDQVHITVVQLRSELRYLQHPRLGEVVIFGTSSPIETIIKFLSAIISRLTGLQVHSFASLEEALLFLKSADSSLPYSPAIDKSG
jgi:hypothetical protein